MWCGWCSHWEAGDDPLGRAATEVVFRTNAARQRKVNRLGGACPGPTLLQNNWENRASRNSPNFSVALNCGIGSSSLNAEVNAFDKLQIVRGLNSPEKAMFEQGFAAKVSDLSLLGKNTK